MRQMSDSQNLTNHTPEPAPVLIARSNARTAIGDPQQALVLGYDTAWPAIPSAQLSVTMIARAMKNAAQVKPATVGDGNRFAGRSIRAASVLIPVVQRDGELFVLLTQRSSELRDHAGQIAFAGGGADDTDANPWATAQREAMEEIGLEAKYLTLLGQLAVYTTVTAYAVTPCVAVMNDQAELKINTHEVAHTFEVPLSFLMNPSHHQQRCVQTPVGERTFYAIPCQDSTGEPRFIWGATAGILRNLYRVLAFELKLHAQ